MVQEEETYDMPTMEDEIPFVDLSPGLAIMDSGANSNHRR